MALKTQRSQYSRFLKYSIALDWCISLFVDAIEVDKNKVLTHLEQEGGFLPLNDKSNPEDIKYHLQMSKKAFKKAVGALYKERIIEISEKGIDLL